MDKMIIFQVIMNKLKKNMKKKEVNHNIQHQVKMNQNKMLAVILQKKRYQKIMIIVMLMIYQEIVL